MRSVRILGVRIDDVTYDEAVALVERYVEERGPHAIVTPNPEFVMLARRQPSFRAALEDSALAVPDGIGLLLAARWLGQPLRQHVRGTDLVHRLAAYSVSRGWRWLLLGAAEGVAAEAARRLRCVHPGLQVVGALPGSPRPEDDEQVRQAIRAAGPADLALVAYGAPAQELWLHRNLGPLDLPVGLGVGGVLNFLAGRVPRAPRWVRQAELEFLYRLWVEPWRWRRQLAIPRFTLLAAAEAVQTRLARARQRGVQ
jgi:N-acetylglucosaminyldiphosphoundecaprenol N-acetyl-beta-D-mannosaminyltransferase